MACPVPALSKMSPDASSPILHQSPSSFSSSSAHRRYDGFAANPKSNLSKSNGPVSSVLLMAAMRNLLLPANACDIPIQSRTDFASAILAAHRGVVRRNDSVTLVLDDCGAVYAIGLPCDWPRGLAAKVENHQLYTAQVTIGDLLDAKPLPQRPAASPATPVSDTITPRSRADSDVASAESTPRAIVVQQQVDIDSGDSHNDFNDGASHPHQQQTAQRKPRHVWFPIDALGEPHDDNPDDGCGGAKYSLVVIHYVPRMLTTSAASPVSSPLPPQSDGHNERYLGDNNHKVDNCDNALHRSLCSSPCA